MDKNRKFLFTLFSLACLIAAGACVIVDLAMTRQITWSAYVILSVAFGWLVLSPLVMRKRGATLSLCAVTLFILPYLYLLEKITPGDAWFAGLGIPAAVIGVVMLWALFTIFRIFKINLWYKGALALFLGGAVAAPLVNRYVDAFTGEPSSPLSYFINISSCLLIAVALGVLGFLREKRKKRR
ncbi:MAG: DUF6320 domain-containing protein [Clostridiales bacterium]|nr:DUF6320 domain-containing protein [Clostridiales bacterium]